MCLYICSENFFGGDFKTQVFWAIYYYQYFLRYMYIENVNCCVCQCTKWLTCIVDTVSRWETLKSLSADKQLSLSTALERARGFHLSWRQLRDQLSQLEEKTTSIPLPHGRPIPCQADLDKHRAFEAEVQGLREAITAFRSEGEGLKSQCAAEDQEMVNRWIGEVEQRWDDILAAVQERQVNGSHLIDNFIILKTNLL